MKILIIDDDLEVLKILKLYFEQSLKATVLTVDRPQLAMVTIEQLQPDIILLDLLLGPENGLNILKKIKTSIFSKAIPVIILSGDKDVNKLKTSLALGAVDYIVKPPKIEVLVQRIVKYYNESKKISGSEATKTRAKEPSPQKEIPADDPASQFASAMQILSKMLSHEELQIPVLPKIAFDIQNKLKDSQADMNEIAEMIKQDIAISSKVLKVSNSSFYCSAAKINDISQAIMRLGVNEIKKIIQLISLKQVFKTSSPQCAEKMIKLWEHSLACAICNQIVAKKDISCDNEKYFMFGLFHDVGKVFLFHLISKAIEGNKSLFNIFTNDIINKLLTVMHHKLGETLIRNWNYSAEFTEIVKNHNDPLDLIKNSKPLLTTFFSNLLTRKIGFSLIPYEGSENDLLQAAALLNLNDPLEQIEAELKENMEKIGEIFHEQ